MPRQNRLLSILLVVLILLSASSAAFTAAAEAETCVVYVSVFGSGSVSDGSQSVKDGLLLEPQLGDSITLTAAPSDGYELLYWVNRETKRIVSSESTYAFSAGSDLYLELYFDEEQAAMAAQNKHRVVYLSEGGNIIYSAEVAIGSTEYMSRVPDVFLYGGGRTWLGWDHTPAEVAADSGRVLVRPVYSNDKSCTVTKIVGNNVTVEQHKFNDQNDKCYMTAPATMDGQPFSYWIVPANEEDPNSRDEISSVHRTYNFPTVMDMTLQAVYGADEVPPYIVRVMGDVPDFENDAVQISVEWSVSTDYTVNEGGILFSRVPVGSEEEFVLGTGNPDIKSSKAEGNWQVGSKSVNITRWYTADPMTDSYYYPLLYVRGYVQVRDGAGNVTTQYSDIYCVDYINKDYIGPDWDNFNDPLG